MRGGPGWPRPSARSRSCPANRSPALVSARCSAVWGRRRLPVGQSTARRGARYWTGPATRDRSGSRQRIPLPGRPAGFGNRAGGWPSARPRPAGLGLLDSACHRPQVGLFGEQAYPSLAGKAAALMHSLACNHALVDGNKRLGLLVAVVFLRINGYILDLTDDEAFDLTMSVAAGQLDADGIQKRLRLAQASPDRAGRGVVSCGLGDPARRLALAAARLRTATRLSGLAGAGRQAVGEREDEGAQFVGALDDERPVEGSE